MRPPHLLAALAGLVIATTPARGEAAPPSPTDIIVIMADDLGFSDLGAFGGEIPTPNLDRLAAGGVRFTQFYTAAKCEPSRAALVTGRHWPAVGHEGSGPSVAEVARAQGYRTFLAGKWHVGGHPLDRGFDHALFMPRGAADFFTGRAGAEGLQLDHADHRIEKPDTFYTTDAFTDQVRDWLRASPAPETTNFVFLAYNAPHNPLQAPRADILRHRGRYLEGWEKIRARRVARQRELGLFPPDLIPAARPQNLPAWDSLSSAQHDLEDLRMATYAAMIERMDANIGRLLDTLASLGRLDSAFILFTSDNGASAFSRTDAAMLRQGLLPGDRNSNWEIGLGWGWVSDAPFRLYKRNQHEGGITSPVIVHWPRGLAWPAGTILDQPSHLVDILPTVHELGGARSESPPLLAGRSLVPLLAHRVTAPGRPLAGALYDHRFYRVGPWKISQVDNGAWELYHLGRDRAETRDLASAQPERVNQLAAAWDAWWDAQSATPHRPVPTEPGARFGDRGAGVRYVPSAMPAALADRLPATP